MCTIYSIISYLYSVVSKTYEAFETVDKYDNKQMQIQCNIK